MEHADTFQLMAEIAAVFAGFSALTSAYSRSGSKSVRTTLRIGQRYNLMISVFVMFSALAPLILAPFGIEGRLLWQLSSLVLLGTSMIATLDFFRIVRGGLPEEVRDRLRRPARDLPVFSTGAQFGLTLIIFFGPDHWPFEAIYLVSMSFGLFGVAAIFAANSMPRIYGHKVSDSKEQQKE